MTGYLKLTRWQLTGGIMVFGALLVGLPAAYATTQTVSTAQAMVNGKQETVLTDAKGLTLYYNAKDGPSKITCTGRCAKYWPPLLLSSGAPTGPAALEKNLTVVDGPLGRQVEFMGHPLYRFVKDTKPGQAYGEGLLDGAWHVAVPDSPRADSPKSHW